MIVFDNYFLDNMGHRNMLCPSQMIDLELDQRGPGFLHPEPCGFLRSVTNFPQPNFHNTLAASGSTTNFDGRHLPESHDSALLYGMMQYDGVQHHRSVENHDLGVPRSNFYIPYMPPSSNNRMFPVPPNYGSSDHFPSSSNYSVVGVSADEYGRYGHLMDGDRGAYKRKNAEGVPGNFQYFNPSASTSSFVIPLDTRLPDGVTAPYAMPQYMLNGLPVREVGSSRGVRNRSGAPGLEPVLAHNHSQLIQGNYVDQPFPPAGFIWFDQQSSSNSGDGGASAWTQPPALPYMHGNNVMGSSIETGDMAVQGYHETANIRTSSSFLHPPPMNLRPPNLHTPAVPLQGVRGHNFQPQVASASYRVPTNYVSRGSVNPSQDGLEIGLRLPGSIPPTGLRIYRPHRVGDLPDSTLRYRNFPHLRVLPSDEVAMLEMPDFYELGNLFDHHRDMRLDIEDMSYEELLALGERIGNVNTGLSEEAIENQLKTRSYLSSPISINLEEAACSDDEPDSCIICQEDYKNKEKIEILNCGHEYHANCLKKWLLLKNVCPICKSEALNAASKEGIA
ncbi:zf-RING_2 domain-containing protein [Cephalotus follicularis]|uniref:RING-type E3 ubiquitin transferase n=1 Tax=Cephalotus follicularis TaxID=3775 RepID=A0A1Q3B7L2_CEPFO|nr:zf-RING_2 domain-containing protein [Cephalotus follicularis]